ncbi:MAG: HlyD family efflux transporter periplasmic adaptor subunit [Sedimentisphaerales bacterium]|nr:HlyD family efflux transporter periplasmic adaptor subunit [Sedimentisphaerales bacterium]
MRRQTGWMIIGLVVWNGLWSPTARSQSANYGSLDEYPLYLQAQRVAILSSELDGKVKTMLAEPQDFVKTERPLLILDDSLAQLALQTLEINLRANKIGADEARVRREYADDNLKIVQELYDKAVGEIPVASVKELKESRQAAELAALAVEKNKIERDSLLIEQKRALEILSRHTIKAPFDGVVTPFSATLAEKYMKDRGQPKRVVAGETVRAGQVVIALMKVDVLRVSHWLPVSQLSRVHLGDKVRVYIQGDDDPVEATVVFIGPTVESTGEFGIEAEFANPPLQPAPTSTGEYRFRYRDGLRARMEFVEQPAAGDVSQ